MRQIIGQKIISVFVIIVFMFNITGCATIPNNNDNNKTFTYDKKTEEKEEIEKDKAEKKELFVGIGPVIPLIDNAYNVLWGLSAENHIKLGDTDWLRGIIGTRLYFGYAKAKQGVESNGFNNYIINYGLYKNGNSIQTGTFYQLITNIETYLFFLEIIGGMGLKIANLFDNEQTLNLKIGISIIDIENISGRILAEEKKELVSYYAFLEPAIYLEFKTGIGNKLIFNKNLYLCIEYGIRTYAGYKGNRDFCNPLYLINIIKAKFVVML